MIVNQWPGSQSCRSSCPLISNQCLGNLHAASSSESTLKKGLPSSHAGGPLDYNYACGSRQHAQPML